MKTNKAMLEAELRKYEQDVAYVNTVKNNKQTVWL